MDERTEPAAAFALQLSISLVTALVLTGVLPKQQAGALIRDTLAEVLTDYPEHEQALRETAATLTVGIGLSRVEMERLMRKEDPERG